MSDLVQRIADVMGCQPDDDDDLVEAVRLLVAERDEAERDRRRDHAIVKGVHGALLDAGMTAPRLEAQLYDSVMAVAAERDEARAEVERLRQKVDDLRVIANVNGDWNGRFAVALAMLRQCHPYVRAWATGPELLDILARLDALIGGRDE